jgi:hypothetical protein
VSALLALACESILGIDGEYVMEPGGMPTGGSTGVTGLGGSGGAAASSGGVPPSTGGTPPNQPGVAPGEDAGSDAARGKGDCRPGHYKGTFTGQHNPVDIPGLELMEVSGIVELDVKADSQGPFSVSGTLVLMPQPSMPSLLSQFEAAIEGTLDCGTAALDAKLARGRLAPVILPLVFEFAGSLHGIHDSTTHTVSGDWTETQIPATQPTGTGTWTATWVRP